MKASIRAYRRGVRRNTFIFLQVHIGRPSRYTEELANTICERIVEGRSLRSVCRDQDMPVASTVFLWLRTYTDFSEQYARAREHQAEAMFEEMLEIAEKPLLEKKIFVTADGTKQTIIRDNVKRSQLMISARKWMLARMMPRKYS